MHFDHSAAEQFLSYVDGETSLDEVWDHQAYDIARNHAALLGMDLTQDDVRQAMAGDETPFSLGDDLDINRDRIADLRRHVEAREARWANLAERQLRRITPDEDLSDLPVYLAIGYEFGIGLEGGAFVDLNQPMFHRDPRQLLYVTIHESSHVVYDRVHGFSSELGPQLLDSREGQQRVFETLFHTEAFATYTPLELRRSDGNLGTHDHPICEDYRAFSDDSLVSDLVREYDSFRESLRGGPVPPKVLFDHVFGDSRLPYRLGCAQIAEIERVEGIDGVREAFSLDPADFFETYDWVLDRFRDHV